MNLRVGEGIDRHRLVEGRPLILGGVEIPHSHGLLGHSDGDALTHAVCDALLGSLALGDLGGHFSDSDPAQAGRDSLEFLRHVAGLLRQRGWRVANVDATVMTEAPRLAPHVEEMRRRLAQAMGVSLEQVSVKATRGEGLGPEGRGESLLARAVALVEQP